MDWSKISLAAGPQQNWGFILTRNNTKLSLKNLDAKADPHVQISLHPLTGPQLTRFPAISIETLSKTTASQNTQNIVMEFELYRLIAQNNVQTNSILENFYKNNGEFLIESAIKIDKASFKDSTTSMILNYNFDGFCGNPLTFYLWSLFMYAHAKSTLKASWIRVFKKLLEIVLEHEMRLVKWHETLKKRQKIYKKYAKSII